MSSHAQSKVSQVEKPRNVVSLLKGRIVIYVVFALVILMFMIFAPNYATVANIEDIGRETAVVTITAVGMTFVIVSAEIDLSIGSVVSFTGLIAAMLMAAHVNWVFASLVALVTGAGIGVVNGVITAYVGVPSFLVTLGTMEIFGGLAEMLTHSLPVPVSSVTFGNVFGDTPFLGIPDSIWWTVIVLFLGFVLLHRTIFGRWVFATGGNSTAAKFVGIPTRRIKLLSFLVIGVLGALGGLILAGRFGAGDPSVGNNMELDAIAACILGGTNLFGGKGTIVGTLIGSVFIGAVGVGMIMLGAGAELQVVVTGAIIVTAVAINKITDR